MTQKLSNGITVPINSDAYQLTADLATMGNSANVSIPVNSQAARDALTPFAGMTVIRLDIPGAPTQTWDGSAWQGAVPITYTPTLTASGGTNPSLGTGTATGQYQLAGKFMTGQFFVPFGTGGSVGSGSYLVSLPTGFSYGGLGSAVPLGVFAAHLTSGDISGYLRLNTSGGSQISMYWQSATGTASPVTNSTTGWTNGCYMTGTFTVPLA
jgi:hypothetical protein